jgi:hypothetical protein
MAWTIGGEDFDYRFKITIDKDQVAANLTDFPVFYDFTDSPAEFWDNVKADGGDIRVAQGSGSTQQAFELKNFNGVNVGQGYFKGSSISSSIDTEFYLYYGNAGASQPARAAAYGSDNVWDSDFLAVYHLEEDPSSGAPQITDSTSNQNDGTTEGTMLTGDLVSAVAGNGLEFDGTDDAADMGFQITSLTGTIEWWHDDINPGGNAVPMSQNSSSDAFLGVAWIHQSPNYNLFIDQTNLIQVTRQASGNQYIVGTYSGSASEGFSNGSSVDTGAGKAPVHNTQNFFLGGLNYSAGTVLEWHGVMDEVRISEIVRPDEYISSTYTNINTPTTFYSAGSEESSAPTFVGHVMIY